MSGPRLETVCAGLRELADIDFQRRVWTGQGLPHEMSSLAEAVETLFDDSGLEPDLGFGRLAFGDEIDSQLRELGVLLGRIILTGPRVRSSMTR
jgi:hypothetical protein